MDRVNSPKALQWLLYEATHVQRNDSLQSSSPTADIEESTNDSLDYNELCRQARDIIADRVDPFGLAGSLLAYVSNQLRSVSHLQGLTATLSPQPVLPSSPSIRLLALCQFSRSGIHIDALNSPIAIAYAEVLESLVGNDCSFHSSVYASLRAQFLRLLAKPEPMLQPLLPLYAVMLVSEAKLSKGDLVALDLFSDALATVRAYGDQCDVRSTYEPVYQLLLAAIEHHFDARECLEAFVVLQPKEAKPSQLSLDACTQFLIELIKEPYRQPNSLPKIAIWYRRLEMLDSSGIASKLFIKGCSASKENKQSDLPTQLGQSLENAIESKVEEHRMSYLLGVIEKGELQKPDELLRAVAKLTDARQLESLANHRVLTASAIASVDRLRDPSVSQLVSPELLRSRLNHWQELNAIHRGFTSRLIAAKRGPFREPPDLVQFAIDVGAEDSVKYFNAKDPNRFPGKGFLVTRLRLDKCFASQSYTRSSKGADPYSIYKKAWPALAGAMDQFDRAEFIFLRGCILISCKHSDYLLPAGNGEHYSLVVFNDHFRNPFQEVAYLVPNRGVAKLLAKTQIPCADFVGFDPRRPDLNDQLQSPQHFLEHASFHNKAIDVGGVSAILSGFENHLDRIAALSTPSELTKSLLELRHKTDAHNKEISEWEGRTHRYHLSQSGQKRMLELSDAGRRLEREANRIRLEQSQLLGRVEESIWRLVDRYTSLHQLLCIAHAYWHRGYTAGRQVSTSHIDESIQDGESMQPAVEQRNLLLEQGTQAIVNRNSIRMLVQAYEWHAMRENPASRREDFPVLVVCDATRIGTQPELDIFVDTFDMSASVNGQRVAFSQGRMQGEDELFWMTTIFPRVQDESGKIRDLRFYPRTSLGIA